MKARYVKPELMVESFTLTQNIANTCSVPGGGNSLGSPSHWSKETCGWKLDDATILWVSTGICSEILDPNEEVEGICYNNPGGDLTIFGS